MIRIVGIGSVIVGLVLYIGFRFKSLASGPQVTISYPPAYSLLDSGFVTVTGTAKRVSQLTVNGQEVLPTTDDTFSASLLVPPGYSILKIEARDRFAHRYHTELPIVNAEHRDAMTIIESIPPEEPPDVTETVESSQET